MKLFKLMFAAHIAAGTGDNEQRAIAQQIFGLGMGQMRTNDFVHNGVWFDKTGAKLGWGDLDPFDFWLISQRLERGPLKVENGDDLFIVTGEAEGHKIFQYEREEDPGWDGDQYQFTREYVCRHARYVIVPGAIYRIEGDGDNDNKHGRGERKSWLQECKREGLGKAEVFIMTKSRFWLWCQMGLDPKAACPHCGYPHEDCRCSFVIRNTEGKFLYAEWIMKEQYKNAWIEEQGKATRFSYDAHKFAREHFGDEANSFTFVRLPYTDRY